MALSLGAGITKQSGAQESLPAAVPSETNKSDMLALSVGYYDANDNEEAVDLRAEYRWQKPLLWKLKPFAGIEASTDGALYGLGGIYLDLQLARNVFFTPSFGAGFYEDSDGKDLGYTLEFRSQLELSYEFKNKHRISFAASHISNADLDHKNPGTELLNIYYQIPVQDLFSK